MKGAGINATNLFNDVYLLSFHFSFDYIIIEVNYLLKGASMG
jgi:hypothetical protein